MHFSEYWSQNLSENCLHKINIFDTNSLKLRYQGIPVNVAFNSYRMSFVLTIYKDFNFGIF